jgi:hypothetical protein
VLKYDNLNYFGKGDENRDRSVIVHQSILHIFENGDNGSLLPEGWENSCYKMRLNVNFKNSITISKQPFILNTRMPQIPTDFDGRRHLTALRTSELETNVIGRESDDRKS